MPSITINGIKTSCKNGATIMEVAHDIGIAIPSLCHTQGFKPGTSCMVCVVKVKGIERLLPACATKAVDGQEIFTDTPEVIESRRMALELLLSDHAGDCEAPCRLACPALLNIPQMLRSIKVGDWQKAATIATNALILPETLGYVCPAPCEKICRRNKYDSPLVIRAMHREAARQQRTRTTKSALKNETLQTGKRVVVIGAGPAGLAALHVLAQAGHNCVLLEARNHAGGALRDGTDETYLPRAVIDAEANAILSHPLITANWNTPLQSSEHLQSLAQDFDAVLLTYGANLELSKTLELDSTASGLQVAKPTGRTSLQNVFAAGAAVLPVNRLSVRAIAMGIQSALAIYRMLNDLDEPDHVPMLNVRLNPFTSENLLQLMKGANTAPRIHDIGFASLDNIAAQNEAARCMHCDCRASQDCELRNLGHSYRASLSLFSGPRRDVDIDDSHQHLIYDAGKCICCGLCIQLAEQLNEAIGLTFAKRGFATRMQPALGRNLSEAIKGDPAKYSSGCPTGALKLKTCD